MRSSASRFTVPVAACPFTCSRVANGKNLDAPEMTFRAYLPASVVFPAYSYTRAVNA